MIFRMLYTTIFFTLFMSITPWWAFSIASFLMGIFINIKTKNKIFLVTSSASISWIGCFTLRYYLGGEIITSRISSMFGLNLIILFALTILIVTAISFLSCYTGNLFRKEFIEIK